MPVALNPGPASPRGKSPHWLPLSGAARHLLPRWIRRRPGLAYDSGVLAERGTPESPFRAGFKACGLDRPDLVVRLRGASDSIVNRPQVLPARVVDKWIEYHLAPDRVGGRRSESTPCGPSRSASFGRRTPVSCRRRYGGPAPGLRMVPFTSGKLAKAPSEPAPRAALGKTRFSYRTTNHISNGRSFAGLGFSYSGITCRPMDVNALRTSACRLVSA